MNTSCQMSDSVESASGLDDSVSSSPKHDNQYDFTRIPPQTTTHIRESLEFPSFLDQDDKYRNAEGGLTDDELGRWNINNFDPILAEWSPRARPRSARLSHRWIPPSPTTGGVWLRKMTEPKLYGKSPTVPAPTKAFQAAATDLETIRLQQQEERRKKAPSKIPSQDFLVPTKVKHTCPFTYMTAPFDRMAVLAICTKS